MDSQLEKAWEMKWNLELYSCLYGDKFPFTHYWRPIAPLRGCSDDLGMRKSPSIKVLYVGSMVLQ